MGDDILGMSLDDIIKQKASKASERSSSRGRGGKSRGGSDYGDRLSVNVKNTSFKRGRGGKRFGTTRAFQEVQVPVRELPRNQEALEGDAAWEHDLYDEGPAPTRRTRPAQQGYKLLITNLDFKVTDEDIRELFENCGTVTKAGVLYDRSGRSEEAAEVIFQHREEAVAAMKRYNNLALDNKPMKIELVEGASGPASGKRTLTSGIMIGNIDRNLPRRSRGESGGSRVGRTGQRPVGNYSSSLRQARGRGPTVSQADLDRDLDSYMATD